MARDEGFVAIIAEPIFVSRQHFICGEFAELDVRVVGVCSWCICEKGVDVLVVETKGLF